MSVLPAEIEERRHGKGSKTQGEGGGTPYMRMIGMIIIFLGVVIDDLVFLGVAQAKYIKIIKPVFVTCRA